MPRSRRYAAYKYEWTMLVNALLTSQDHLLVDYPSEKDAENQRQEWYAFLGACQHEAERAKNTPEFKHEMSQFYNQASQIACRRNGSQLSFIKKSATESGRALREAIQNQLGPPEFGAPEERAPSPEEGAPSPEFEEPDLADPYGNVLSKTGLEPDDEESQSGADDAGAPDEE